MMFYASQVVGDGISEASTVGTGIFSGSQDQKFVG